MKHGSLWLGGGISLLALFLAFRQVNLDRVAMAFSRTNYLLVAAAVGIQLLAVGAIACRWGLFFRRQPSFSRLLSSLYIAQLVNGVLPVRLGMFVRAYLVGKEEGQSAIAVFTTVVAEKVFDSLAFVLLFATVLPLFAPNWFHWSSLGLSTGVFVGLFPLLVLLTYQRQRFLQLARRALQRVPFAEHLGLLQKFEVGLEGLAQLRGRSTLGLLWGWTLVITGLGILVNWVVLNSLAIQVPWGAAALLLVALQVSSKVLPAATLGGIGIFQYICMETLGFFSVDQNLALSFGFMLYFIVLIPGSTIGAVALYRTPFSLRRLQTEMAKEA